MSVADPLETKLTASQFRATLATGKFRLKSRITFLGTFADGARYEVSDQYRVPSFFLVTDLNGPTLDNSKQTEVSIYDKSGNAYTSVSLGSSTQRGLPMQLWPTLGGTPLNPAGGQPTGTTIRLPVSIPAADTLTTTFAAGATINTLPATIDGANNAYAQTALAAATVTQLVTSGTLYRDLRIKNVGANPVSLGFDNLVVAGSGYVLEKLGVDDELPLSGFNTNLWGFSTLGTTVAIFARG